MVGRLSLVAVLVAALGLVPALAQQQATVILNDGERFVGTLTGTREGNLHLTMNGEDRAFSREDVAAVMFIQRRPPDDELSELPMNAPPSAQHVLVLNDGTIIHGRIDEIVRGDIVRVDMDNGQRRSFYIDEIRRMYFNPGAARRMFARGMFDRGEVGTAGREGNTVQVDGRRPWTDTGMRVRRGERLSFQSSGQIQWGNRRNLAGPGGSVVGRGGRYPVDTLPVGALIGQVGNGPAFPIGSNVGPIDMPADGELYLGVNDDYFGDNRGAFSVSINRENVRGARGWEYGPPRWARNRPWGRGQQPVGTSGWNGWQIRVEANRPWTDTGIDVQRGDQLSFGAYGQIQWVERSVLTGPDGGTPAGTGRYPVSALGVGALIARVGDSQPFALGSNSGLLSMPASGRLYLGINDDYFGDNSGYFTVTLSR